jgi:hypothetical protein
MDSEAGGWLWLIIDVAFVALFAAALFYGIVMWRNRRRNPRMEQARDRATEDLYHRPSSE